MEDRLDVTAEVLGGAEEERALELEDEDPSPLLLTALYMAGILTGYALLTAPEEWQRAWETVRQVWARRRQG